MFLARNLKLLKSLKLFQGISVVKKSRSIRHQKDHFQDCEKASIALFFMCARRMRTKGFFFYSQKEEERTHIKK